MRVDRTKQTQIAVPRTTSPARGEKTRMKPRSFTSAAKLDTQNGAMKNRAVAHASSRTGILVCPDPDRAFKTNAIPTIKDSPNEVSHRRRLGSKYRTSTTRYHKR